MAIKRNSCRVTERSRMIKLSAQGLSIPQISNAVSVHEHIVDEVVSGRWAAAEKLGKAQQSRNDEVRSQAKENEEVTKAAAIAAATVRALKGMEDADVPKEEKAEAPPAEEELSPQQKGHITRRANAAAAADAA